MLSTMLRSGGTVLRTSAAALAVGAAVVLTAPLATAADATVATDTDVYAVGETIQVTGSCPTSAVSAVLELTQGTAVLATDTVDVDAGAVTASLEVGTDAEEGLGLVTLSCLDYGSSTPVATASAPVLLVEDVAFEEIPVTVSPSRVALGAPVTITATCPAGSTTADVLAGNTDVDDPFLDRTVTPAADGTVRLTVPVVAANGVTPKVGDAGAIVFCDGDVFAVGVAEFQIVAAPVAPVSRDTDREELASTGTQAGDLAQVAGLLILAGGAALVISRRTGAARP